MTQATVSLVTPSSPDTPNSSAKSAPSKTPTRTKRASPIADDPMRAVSSAEEQVSLVARTISEYNKMRVAAIGSEKARLHACCGCGKRCGKGPDGKKISMRPDLVAGMQFRAAGKFVNSGTKLVGTVPGVPVGKRFECRYDMVIVGLMTQHMAGIDVQQAAGGQKSFVTAIVHSGTYEDNDVEKMPDGEMIYTGRCAQLL